MTPFFYGDYMAYGEIPILNTIIDYKVLSDETVYTKINFKWKVLELKIIKSQKNTEI